MKRALNFSLPFFLGVLLTFVIFGSTNFFTSAIAEPQPSMQSALVNLQAAKRNLINASHDKGGHRSNALALVNQAIIEVKKGIRYDDKY